MGIKTSDLVGRWRKVGDDNSTATFPAEVEFFPDGTYRATQEGPRRADWDEASFDVLEDGSVRMETANDRKVTYAAELDQDVLTLGTGNRQVRFRRMS
jgi:hypothetical protein